MAHLTSTAGTRVVGIVKRLIPGIGRVEATIPTFAAAWQNSNEAALKQDGPLWVALGDSMTQGIGARAFTGGWVGQLHEELAAAGIPLRLVNLSVTGAKIHDVVDDQIPRLQALGIRPELVTVLIGANDMLGRRSRSTAVSNYGRLLDVLPRTVTVVATLPRRNKESVAINALIDEAAATGSVRTADMRGLISIRSLLGSRAGDFFHPNERGYATIVGAFAETLGIRADSR